MTAVLPTSTPVRHTVPCFSGPHGAVLEHINRMIASGNFDVFFTALKGFRNGVVYGARVRAPHALVLNLVWSKSPYSSMPAKILKVTRMHAFGLGYSAVTFAIVRGLLRRLQGATHMWHNALAGFMVGSIFWGDPSNGVHIQMMMYMLARIICAVYHLLVSKYGLSVPPVAYRLYMGCLWSLAIMFLMYSPDKLQSSMMQSLEYIFKDSGRFSSWYDLLVVNSADTPL
ncbi:hypothetical protein JKF63_04296 [Porcisia hertigi]|uniref:Peroxisomal membrane protein 4 n=1 Tax=Porcisia hertigi TaxID=2761500 RepID=A0A836HZE4_9TRYP|nr:hypothetical protein JKF63_04296 [Porcisia hertigi]